MWRLTCVLFLSVHLAQSVFFHELSSIELAPDDGKKDSSFGFSLGYQNGKHPNLVIGAPRYDETGRVYQRSIDDILHGQKTCKHIDIDFDKLRVDYSRALSLHQNFYLGASIAATEEFFMTCAPLRTTYGIIFKNGTQKATKFGTFGACFKYNKEKGVKKLNYGFEKYYNNHSNSNNHIYGGAGWSTLVDKDRDRIIISKSFGAFGDLTTTSISKADTETETEFTSFVKDNEDNKMIFNKLTNIALGMTFGNYFHAKEANMTYTAVSMKREDARNTIMFFESVNLKKNDWQLDEETVGSMFGVSLCSADVTADGLDELVVGAPAHVADTRSYDKGAVHIYTKYESPSQLKMRHKLTILGEKDGARFGTTLAKNDVDGDSYPEIFVSAPYENSGIGALYVLCGFEIYETIVNETSKVFASDLRRTQRISAESLRSFGYSVQPVSDFNDNGSDELSIGSPGSSKVILLKGIRSITANVTSRILGNPSESDSQYAFASCVTVKLPPKPTKITTKLLVKNVLNGNNAEFDRNEATYEIDLATAVGLMTANNDTEFCKNLIIKSTSFFTVTTNISVVDDFRVIKDFQNTWVTLSAQTKPLHQVRLTCLCNETSCEPDYAVTIERSGSNSSSYLVGSSTLENVTISVNNRGTMGCNSCLKVRVSGTRVDLIQCHEEKGVYECAMPDPFRGNATHKIDLVLLMDILNNEERHFKVDVEVRKNCGNPGEALEPLVVDYVYNTDAIILDGTVSNRNISEKELKDENEDIVDEQIYTIKNNHSVTWKKAWANITATKRPYIQTFKISMKHEVCIESSDAEKFYWHCPVTLDPYSKFDITVSTTVLKKEIMSAVSSPIASKQYRSDYEYNQHTDTFYKLHIVGASNMPASEKCIEEGAERLTSISSDNEVIQVLTMLQEQDKNWSWENLLGGDWVVEPGNGAFICKVIARDAAHDKECNVYSNDYESKISTTGSCYRVSTVKATWNEAHASCHAEGAHLVILDNAEELEVLYNMLKDKPHDSETQYFAGVRADTTTEPRVFKTVLNQTLEQVGYGPWEEEEPNDWHGGENCVVLDTRRHGKYNDVWCHVKMPYVCESSAAPAEIDAPPSSTPSSVSDLVSSPFPSKQYRPDYEYNENTDAFYKLHIESEQKYTASSKCIEEGAELAKITSDEDLKQIHAMMKKLPDLEDYVMVASGENFDYNIRSQCKVVNRKGKMETLRGYQDVPFVCKVAAEAAPYNEECGVYSNDYVSRVSTTGSCYRVSAAEATWNEAYASCQAEGAHLVILSNAEELEVLYQMINDEPHYSDKQYFAGVRTDSTTEPRVFKTVLKQVGYGPWEEEEPNNYEGGENCVALDTRRHGKYNDVWCHVKMPYVCERPVTASLDNLGIDIHAPPSKPNSDVVQVSDPVPPHTTQSKRYRPDYEYNENTDAFYKLHTVGARKTEASRKCIAEGAELVTIISDEDSKQVLALMKRLSYLEDYVMVQSNARASDAVRVEDDFPKSFSNNIGPLQENLIYGSRNDDECNVMNRKGKIETTSADQELPFVCKVAARKAPYSYECGVFSNDYESRISTTGSCYRVSTDHVTWNEAHATCQAEGAHLVILSSPKELQVLYYMLQAKPHDYGTQYFAGVRADITSEPRVFKTVLNQTLEEVGYGPWDEYEPDNNQGGENCVTLDMHRHGKYSDVPCHSKMPYVCESSRASNSDISKVSDLVLSTLPSKQYRPNYEYNKKTDAFYKLHTDRASKRLASKKCKEEGAELAQVTSYEDLQQIQAMMKRIPVFEDFVMFGSGEYIGYGSQHDFECNVVNSEGEIGVKGAYFELPFVCKITAIDAPINKECNVFSNDYESRISTTGSCYRVSTVQASWSEANANCQAEGAHLVILSSPKELEVLVKMLRDKPHNSETQYFAGVRAVTFTEPRVFKTVFDQTLEEVGYGPWDENEPNDWHGGENCVVLDTRRHGKYNDVPCSDRMMYVCERPVVQLEIQTTPSVPIARTGFASFANIFLSVYSFFTPYFGP